VAGLARALAQACSVAFGLGVVSDSSDGVALPSSTGTSSALARTSAKSRAW
jgi:hypothetical protein